MQDVAHDPDDFPLPVDEFNPLVFGRPADGTLGTTPRGFLRGPGINQSDISLFKNTRVGQRVNVQFRLETFNTFNQVQFNGINTAVNVPNAGQPVTDATRGLLGQVTSFRATADSGWPEGVLLA